MRVRVNEKSIFLVSVLVPALVLAAALVLETALGDAAPANAQGRNQNFTAGTPSSPVSQAASAQPAQEWLRYYKGEGRPDFARMSAFIAAHPDFPAMGRLRADAEKMMPANYPDAQILQWFAHRSPQSVRGAQAYAGALRRAGRNDQAKMMVNDWWRSASLSRGEQQEAYAAFQSLLERKAHEDRLRFLIHRDHYSNARALAGTMGPGYLALAEARIATRTGQGNANALINRVPAGLISDEGLLFDRLQYRRKAGNNSGAIEMLNASPGQAAMHNAEDWARERSIIVRRLFEEKNYPQAYRLAANHQLKSGAGFAQNEWMAGWIALEYLNKPWEAFEHFERLFHNVGSPISKSRGAYWAGLASERLNHPEIAAKWYNVGAGYPATFYGQLAAVKIGRAPTLRNAALTPNNAVRQTPLAQAARWLKNNGHRGEAGMFLTRLTDSVKTPQDYAAVAAFARELDLPNHAIRAAQESERATGVALVNEAFPRIENHLAGIDFVEWALVHALIRQESRYDSAAISSAGARGLMQLMPATAREVASRAGVNHNNDWLITRPAHNIALGSRYLRQMLNRYDGDYAMALAAYNAGPARVDRWIKEIGDPRRSDVDLVNWIENIPIYETRNYVQRVLEAVQVYRETLTANKGQPHGDIHLARH